MTNISICIGRNGQIVEVHRPATEDHHASIEATGVGSGGTGVTPHFHTLDDVRPLPDLSFKALIAAEHELETLARKLAHT